jgi:phenylalanyl-tRNA synthetase beta chain
MIALSDRGEEIHQKTTVTILDPDLCPRYVARMVEGMKIGPSPFWMRDRLKKVGIRSINNVVDVTNYVMMEYGQPLHAFDFKLLEEGRIVVRRAKEGETFTTLDGVERKLDGQMLMICDGVKLVAIAGVMGGINSEIKEDTETVLLESAYFDPMGNRRTAKELGLETEAAYHFSRGVDYGGTPIAASRAVQLIQELAGGRVVEGVVDMYPKPIPTPPIRLRTRKVNQLLGTEILANRMRAYLEGLGLKVRVEDEETLMVIPPTFRRDLEREIDLIEEIARMDGYEKIPATLPKGSATFKEKKKEFLMERKMLEVLIHYGYYEVVTYSFTSPASLDSIRLVFNDRRREQIQILNPLSEDFSTLRTSLIPGLLETARYNAFRKNSNLKLFELKRVFLPQEGERLPKESKYLSGLAMGFDAEPHWALVQRPIDFHDIKGCVKDLLAVLQINHFQFKRAEDIPYLYPGKAARVLLGEEVLGILGEVHPQVLSHYEIHGKAYLFEMDFGQLVKWAVEEKRFKPLPKFPPIYRDLSLVVDEAMAVEKVVEAIWAIQHPFIDKVNLFDVYRGVPIPDGKKSVSYRIRYQSENRTLTDDEVNQYHEEVISSLKEIFKVELRQ